MSDYVTISGDMAKDVAHELRIAAGESRRPEVLLDYADTLDPPQRSLRDEMVAAHTKVMFFDQNTEGVRERAMDAALAVARKHIEGLPDHPYGVGVLAKSDVLRTLGDNDE